jgi:LEA14-like dessication related protein
MGTRCTRRTFLSTLLVTAGGCAAFNGESTLDVTLVNLAGGGSGGVGEASFNCVIRLQNSSPDELRVIGGAYKVYLDGVYLGEALTHEPITVPGLGSATQTVTVNLSTFRLAASLFRVYESHKASYKLTSTVYTTGALGRSTHRITKEGAVDFDALEQPKSPAATP